MWSEILTHEFTEWWISADDSRHSDGYSLQIKDDTSAVQTQHLC